MRGISARTFRLLAIALLGVLAESPRARASIVLEHPFGADEHAESARERYGILRTEGELGAFGAKLNEACVRAHLDRITFEAIPKYSPYQNYCELPLNKLPKDVRAMVEKVEEMNAKVAAVLGQSVTETFPMNVGITISADFRGSLVSEASGGGVFLTALPDWTYGDFSSKIYVHEIIHTLTFNEGPTAQALLGLQDHPLLIEGFPDLVSAVVHESPKMELGEKRLPDCIRFIRDSTPIRTFDEPFAHFTTIGNADEIVQCCATLNLKKEAPFTKALCNFYTNGQADRLKDVADFVQKKEITTTPYDDAHRNAPFEAEECKIRTATGLVFMDNCDLHQFAYPLVSFFFRLQALTGKSYVTEFFGKIREGAARAAVYECGFTGPKVTENLGGAKSYVSLRPVLAPFIALRESLDSRAQAAFDQAWKEHGFGKMVDLDRLYRKEALPGIAFMAVKSRNALYRDMYFCRDAYRFDAVDCAIRCDKRL